MTAFPDKKTIMSAEEFSSLRDLIEREFGILLRGDRRLTLHTKVSHRLSILGLSTYKEYYDFIVADPTREELFILASHITNNETYFFRERPQLDALAEILQDIKREKQGGEQRLRILSLASSSGEEAYSLNILIHESGLFAWNWDVEIIGIDIDRTAVSKAHAATYTANSFRSLNGDMSRIQRYFTVEDGRYELKRAYAKNVEFRHANILDSGLYAGLAPVDVIFCRNVLIYMSDPATERLVSNFSSALTETGYLFIGSAESLIQKTNLFTPEYREKVIVYRKNSEAQADAGQQRT
ncbi:MAG: protein-glutamate O-methyltransferase CheR [Nitrospiraceae bacterium]|nr:protein-glutamate O-methyltransferase CheR [Nitrospiraceae bacterium]